MTNTTHCDVLVVEDDVMQCEEIAGFLAYSRLDVAIANDGSSALRQAIACRPRVALLDYNLPDTNGVELAKGLRKLLPQTAIIVMSGRIDGLAERTLSETGISVFVNKPLPLGLLRQAVLKLVRSAPANPGGPHQTKGWLAAGIGAQR
jgi:two-component system KDP operon response regulator KdpE